jgi:NAD-dependent dihydropyrimidine dehydrogenase PreA subunit
MILNRNYYEARSFLRSWWDLRQMKKLLGEKIFKSFKLHKTSFPDSLYFYSPRLKRRPKFVGNAELLSKWKDAKICETLCPTHAIKVTAEAIHIDDRGCITCGLCVEFAPPGLLEMSSDSLPLHRS